MRITRMPQISALWLAHILLGLLLAACGPSDPTIREAEQAITDFTSGLDKTTPYAADSVRLQNFTVKINSIARGMFENPKASKDAWKVSATLNFTCTDGSTEEVKDLTYILLRDYKRYTAGVDQFLLIGLPYQPHCARVMYLLNAMGRIQRKMLGSWKMDSSDFENILGRGGVVTQSTWCGSTLSRSDTQKIATALHNKYVARKFKQKWEFALGYNAVMIWTTTSTDGLRTIRLDKCRQLDDSVLTCAGETMSYEFRLDGEYLYAMGCPASRAGVTNFWSPVRRVAR